MNRIICIMQDKDHKTLTPLSNRGLGQNHSWLSASAWGPFDPLVSKHMRAQMLGIEMLWVMLVVAVTQQLEEPELGCERYTNEADCLVMTSPFDPGAAACAWDPALEDACALAPPDASSQFTPLNMSLLVIGMFLINPILLLVEWFYLSVFNAPRAGLKTGEHARQQQRWVWEAAARRRQPEQGAEAAAGEPDAERAELAGWETPPHEPPGSAAGELATIAPAYDVWVCCASTADPKSHVESDDPGVDMSARHVREVRGSLTVRLQPAKLILRPRSSASASGGGGDEAALPDPNDSAALDAFIEMTTARECLAVVARRAELTRALEYVETKNDARRVQKLRAILSAFDRRWGFAPPRCASYYLLGSTESEDERLEARSRATCDADEDIAKKQDG